jgi:protoporphyrinogen IX oxidase
MTGWLGDAYLWVKAAHIIFVIFWMAGLFMLPRFLVYHQEAPAGSEEAARWIHREERLIKIILNPAMITVWILGVALALDVCAFTQGWFHVKLLMVLGLSAYHGWMISYTRKLASGVAQASGKTLRLLNEVPGIAAIFIVIMVIVRPFT